MIRELSILVYESKNYNLTKTYNLNEEKLFATDLGGFGVDYSHFINNTIGQEEWNGFNVVYDNLSFNLNISTEYYNTFINEFRQYHSNPKKYNLVLKYKPNNSTEFYYRDIVLQSFIKGEVSQNGLWEIETIFNPIGAWYSESIYDINVNHNATLTIPNFSTQTSRTGEILIYLPTKNNNLLITNDKDGSGEDEQRLELKSVRDDQVVRSNFGFIDFDYYGVEINWNPSSKFDDVISGNIFIRGNGEKNYIKVKNLGQKKDGKIVLKKHYDGV